MLKLQEALEHIANPAAPPLIMSSGVPRSGGLHLSTILRDLYGYSSKDAEKSQDEVYQANVAMSIGFAWEILIGWAIGQVFHQADLEDAGILIHPGEYELDGVRMSPDALWVYEDCLEEWKCTQRSTKRHISEQRLWLWQAQSYCKAIGFTKVRFRVLHLRGDYGHGPSGQPCVKTWVIEFTPEELEANWCMVMLHKDSKEWPVG